MWCFWFDIVCIGDLMFRGFWKILFVNCRFGNLGWCVGFGDMIMVLEVMDLLGGDFVLGYYFSLWWRV